MINFQSKHYDILLYPLQKHYIYLISHERQLFYILAGKQHHATK